MNRKIAFSFIFVIVAVATAGFFLEFKPSENTTGQVSGISVVTQDSSVKSFGFEYDNLIKQSLDQSKTIKKWPSAKLGITSHHLPTATGFISEFYNSLSATPPKTFVIIGPDHFEHCSRAASTTERSYSTPYGVLEANSAIVNDLIANGNMGEIDGCFDGEHSVGVHAAFVKLLYPKSTIVPIIYSSSAIDDDIAKVTAVLNKYKSDITVIFSVDFNHYQSVQVANQSDKDSGDMIQKLNGAGLTLRHMDSPASINTAIALAKMWNLKPQMLRHANSYDFTGQSENTTGYWNIVFTP